MDNKIHKEKLSTTYFIIQILLIFTRKMENSNLTSDKYVLMYFNSFHNQLDPISYLLINANVVFSNGEKIKFNVQSHPRNNNIFSLSEESSSCMAKR